ncbi:cell division [Tritrichomonas musculus]|uniref:Cell division n=1 Tax=Tritrichomonas musculus TaxID=1915356 RepID=A0ABR2GMM2_9EUKA
MNTNENNTQYENTGCIKMMDNEVQSTQINLYQEDCKYNNNDCDNEQEYSDPDISYNSDCTEEEESDSSVNDPYEFSRKIFDQLLLEEKSINVSIDKIKQIQHEVTLDDREQVIMWLFRLNTEWMYPSDVTYSAITYFNIYLSTTEIQKSELKLVIVTCFRIAAKVELVKYPNIEQLNKTTGENFTTEMLNAAEIKIIVALSFKLSYPTVKAFMKKLLYGTEISQRVYYISNIIVEKVTIKSEFLKYYPSLISAAVVSTVLAGTGDFNGAKKVILESQCTDIPLMYECVSKMIDVGKKLTAALSHFNDNAPIIKMFENTSFEFDASSVFVI